MLSIIKKNKTTLSALIVATTFMLASTQAFALTGAQFSKEAKITLHQAQKIALRAFPGKITDEELEKEGGGSGLRYSFDIQKGKIVHEVGVDAITGKVLENNQEGKNPD